MPVKLIQHDSSHHLWAPNAGEKWYLITSLDDFSRYILYAQLLKKETSWAHILALQATILNTGCRSLTMWIVIRYSDLFKAGTPYGGNIINLQMRQILNGNRSYTTVTLRLFMPCLLRQGQNRTPYRWLQDRLVRTCVRDNVTDIKQAQRILNHEIHRYNYRQVHSTTQEVPYFRFQKALKEGKSLLREFKIRHPYQSAKDIFCLRLDRTVDPYRKISINNMILKINDAKSGDKVNIRIYPLNNSLSELRFWCNGRLVDVQRAKNQDLNLSIL